jgi:hypothetical protein
MVYGSQLDTRVFQERCLVDLCDVAGSDKANAIMSFNL